MKKFILMVMTLLMMTTPVMALTDLEENYVPDSLLVKGKIGKTSAKVIGDMHFRYCRYRKRSGKKNKYGYYFTKAERKTYKKLAKERFLKYTHKRDEHIFKLYKLVNGKWEKKKTVKKYWNRNLKNCEDSGYQSYNYDTPGEIVGYCSTWQPSYTFKKLKKGSYMVSYYTTADTHLTYVFFNIRGKK